MKELFSGQDVTTSAFPLVFLTQLCSFLMEALGPSHFSPPNHGTVPSPGGYQRLAVFPQDLKMAIGCI